MDGTFDAGEDDDAPSVLLSFLLLDALPGVVDSERVRVNDAVVDGTMADSVLEVVVGKDMLDNVDVVAMLACWAGLNPAYIARGI